MNDSPPENTHPGSQRQSQSSRTTEMGVASVGSEPVAEKKLEKFKLEPNIAHSVVPIKWTKDHIKAKSFYKSEDNCQLIMKTYQNSVESLYLNCK